MNQTTPEQWGLDEIERRQRFDQKSQEAVGVSAILAAAHRPQARNPTHFGNPDM
jgi:hypothetical protein